MDITKHYNYYEYVINSLKLLGGSGRNDEILEKVIKLGLVDKLFDPHPCGHDMYESEIAFSGFVISCCQSTGILQLIEAPFDLVSQRIDEAIDRYRIFAH